MPNGNLFCLPWIVSPRTPRTVTVLRGTFPTLCDICSGREVCGGFCLKAIFLGSRFRTSSQRAAVFGQICKGSGHLAISQQPESEAGRHYLRGIDAPVSSRERFACQLQWRKEFLKNKASRDFLPRESDRDSVRSSTPPTTNSKPSPKERGDAYEGREMLSVHAVSGYCPS